MRYGKSAIIGVNLGGLKSTQYLQQSTKGIEYVTNPKYLKPLLKFRSALSFVV
jgi:hypothetical protein